MEKKQSLSEDHDHADQFSDIQCTVLDAICDLDNELNTNATSDDLNAEEEPDELAGQNFQKLLDFTMLKPISPTTPALPQNPVCTTPFTGGEISHVSRTAVKTSSHSVNSAKLILPIVDAPTNASRYNDPTTTVTVTKKRKPPSIFTPKETPKPKQVFQLR